MPRSLSNSVGMVHELDRASLIETRRSPYIRSKKNKDLGGVKGEAYTCIGGDISNHWEAHRN